MAIHTLFSSGRLPENKRGGIAQLQQGAVWVAYKPFLRVWSNSRGLFAVWFRSKLREGAADTVLPKATPNRICRFPMVSERLVEEETRVRILLSLLAP